MTKLLTQIRKKAPRILKAYDVSKAAVFGSVAIGAETKRSDIDILIELDNDSSLLDLIDIQMKLEKIFGRKVDLLTYNSLHPRLKEQILSEQVIIYG